MSTEVFRCWWDPAAYEPDAVLTHEHDEDGDGFGTSHAHDNDGDHSHNESAPLNQADSVLNVWDQDLENNSHEGNDGHENDNLSGSNDSSAPEGEKETSNDSWEYQPMGEPTSEPRADPSKQGNGRRLERRQLDHGDDDYCWSAHSESQLEYMQQSWVPGTVLPLQTETSNWIATQPPTLKGNMMEWSGVRSFDGNYGLLDLKMGNAGPPQSSFFVFYSFNNF